MRVSANHFGCIAKIFCIHPKIGRMRRNLSIHPKHCSKKPSKSHSEGWGKQCFCAAHCEAYLHKQCFGFAAHRKADNTYYIPFINLSQHIFTPTSSAHTSPENHSNKQIFPPVCVVHPGSPAIYLPAGTDTRMRPQNAEYTVLSSPENAGPIAHRNIPGSLPASSHQSQNSEYPEPRRPGSSLGFPANWHPYH